MTRNTWVEDPYDIPDIRNQKTMEDIKDEIKAQSKMSIDQLREQAKTASENLRYARRKGVRLDFVKSDAQLTELDVFLRENNLS